MTENIFQGQLVRLGADEPATVAAAMVRWSRDSEYYRLLDDEMPHLRSTQEWQAWMEKELEDDQPYRGNFFSIHTLEGDRYIGFVGLGGIAWHHGEASIGIGIGEREFWGRGYGTDAMRVILRYAFTELNLFRVSLGTFEYNARAIRSYEKAGFVLEGRIRQTVNRAGRRWDLLCMGILKEDWERDRARQSDG